MPSPHSLIEILILFIICTKFLLSIYLWIDVYLFHCLAVINRDVQISLWKEIELLGLTPMSGITRSCGSSIFNLLRNLQTDTVMAY